MIFLPGMKRIGRFDRPADDDRVEPVDLPQLVLPAHQLFQLVLALDIEVVDDVFGDDDEEREVDRVDAFAQDRALAAALAAASADEERSARPGSCCNPPRGPASGWAAAARRRGHRRSRSFPAEW